MPKLYTSGEEVYGMTATEGVSDNGKYHYSIRESKRNNIVIVIKGNKKLTGEDMVRITNAIKKL